MKYKIIIFVLLVSVSDIFSQPYLYHSKRMVDTLEGDFYRSQRLNLLSGEIEEFPNYDHMGPYYQWDPGQRFLFVVDNFKVGNILFDCFDTTKVKYFWGIEPGFDGTEIGGLLYRADYGNLYVFSDPYGSIEAELYVYNTLNQQITSSITIPEMWGHFNSANDEAFFSNDSSKIYFCSRDTLTDIDIAQVWVYSVNSNQIISKQNLSNYGYPGAEYYTIIRGKSGKGIIRSFDEDRDICYYNIYDFDNSTSSNFIATSIYAEPFFTNYGKYLILSELEKDTVLMVYPTGILKIYNLSTSQLIKTINLPPRGEFYYFDNYPNDIYYVKDIKLPTRQIFVLKMDSIFNELDLSSLTPSTAVVNSPSFTITVKGRGFDSLSTVYFNGQTRTTTFVSDSLLTAQILSSDISIAGNFPVWVTDKWAVSDTMPFTVTQASSPDLTVNLKNSQGALLTTGSLQYYEGSWKDAVNNGDGTFTVITNQNNVSLRMTYEYASQTVSNIPAHYNTYTFQTVNAGVQLKNSLGNLIDQGTVQYYAGAWRSFGTTISGVATKELLPINYSFRMTYEYASIDKQQNLSVDPTVVFQTVNSAVQLKNSQGNLIDMGTVQYYAGAWRTFGTTTNGVATKELLPINYSFRMTYEFASIDRQQNLSADPTVVFQTANATVQLKNSQGNLIDMGTVQYYAGAWRTFGTTTNGVATKELLPINYSFRMTYEFASIDKQQNLSSDPTIVFQTVNAAVQLKNSLGNLIDVGTVQYYAGAWRSFGTTTNGVVTKELLPINYSFRMSYEFASIDKQQNLSTDPTVVFQTANATVQLKNSQGNLIDVGTVQYYAGAWRNFGTTTNGVATKELLPINYSFRMTYAFASIDKQQNLSTDPTVVFQTVNATVQFKNSLGNLMPAPMGDVGTVQYYAGAWRSFGTTTNGVATKELLPINYSFRMTYEFASIDKQQNLSSDPTIVFQTANATVQLKNSQGNLIDVGTVQYYAGAWRSFGTTSNGVATKELLPINYSFRMTHEYLSKDKQQNLSTNPVVDFTTVLCSVKVSKMNNQPLNNANVKYYGGAWRDFGITNANGITTKELLPSNISFRASYGNVSLDKQQDINTNNLVEIRLNVP